MKRLRLRKDARRDKGVPLDSDSSRDEQRYGEEMADLPAEKGACIKDRSGGC